MLYNNILETIGNTPIVKINKFNTQFFNLYAKCEFLNPGGSVKDRIGYAMIKEAENQGLLKPGGTIIEATAGNTGIALAIPAIQSGYKLIAVMTDKASEDKIKVLTNLGVNVYKLPYNNSEKNPGQFIHYAREFSKTIPNSWFVDQFYNKINFNVHYEYTGPEIWHQMNGEVNVLVAGAGTGATLCGAGKFLKEKNPDIKIVLADPVGSIHSKILFKEKDPKGYNYLVEGIGGDFIPGNTDLSIIDDAIQIEDKTACEMCHLLFKKEGLFVGASSGATFAAALSYCYLKNENQKKRNMVTIFSDCGRNYLETFYNPDWCQEKFGKSYSEYKGIVKKIE